jgi:rhodanese-related sulfurtransferase
MILKQPIQSLFLGLTLFFCLLLGVGQNPVLATTFPQAEAVAQASSQTLSQSTDLQAEVDRFLSTIPPNYYKIANVEGLKNQLKNPQTLLVDVREISEYNSGHIPKAINIPLRTLARHLEQIPRDRTVVLYCSSGYRSAMGVMTLQLLGYENVQGFPPSFAAWQSAGEAIASRDRR